MKLKYLKNLWKLITVSFLLLSFSSCQIFMAAIELPKTKATAKFYSNGEKQIAFVGTHHLGKAEYYESLKEVIANFKEDDYIVYYEIVNNPDNLDSLSRDTINRKLRRIFGFRASVEFYDSATEGTFLENLDPQPKYSLLGIDSLDINADINTLQFLDYFESKFRKVILTQQDFDTPLNERVTRLASYSESKDIAINYRNKVLAEIVNNSSDTKILIVYGIAHRKGFYKELKKLDENWKKQGNSI